VIDSPQEARISVGNVYKSDPGKLAAWTSASYVENAPKKKESPTP
jgi:hypothetical protein